MGLGEGRHPAVHPTVTSDPPPKDCKVWHRGAMLRVSRMAVEGLRIQQRRGRPDLDVILIAERQAAAWLALAVFESGARAKRRAMAR